MPTRFAVLACLLLGCASPQPKPVAIMDPGRLEHDFQAQFARSAAAWNRGDLDGFMSDYAADSLPTFVAGGHLIRGHDAIRARYAPLFAPGAQRDSLRFEEMSVRRITDRFVLVSARYVLYRNGATTASGPFTLLMERQPEGWKILHDHSSSD